VILRSTCVSMGGAFQGVGSSCYFPYKCHACCSSADACTFGSSGACPGGTVLGISYPGASNGACCFDDECCRRMSGAACASAGGTYLGNGSSCASCADLCPADVDGDGDVDVNDMVAVILAWGTANAAADVNDDGIVNVSDLIAVIVGWGTCPPCA
jgi:hypothetical protein